MSSDEFDKETGSSDGLQPKQADLSCVHALNELHSHEIHVVLRMSRSVPEGMSRSVPKGMSRSVPEGMSRSVPEGMSRSVPEGMSRSVPS
ncbi:hypothetical protein Tco_0414614 [Tanacetum coccineum]